MLTYISLPCGFETPRKTYKQSEQEQKSKSATRIISIVNGKPTVGATWTSGKTDTSTVEGTDSKARAGYVELYP